MKFIVIVVVIYFSSFSWAQTHVAIVKTIRGGVVIVDGEDQSKALKKNDLVALGSTLKSDNDSTLSLVFQDNSRISLAGDSEITISYFSENYGVIDLIKGRLRAVVSGDRSQAPKIFIRTTNSLIGVRDGEFLTAFYNDHTSTVIFDNEIYLKHSTTKVKSEPSLDNFFNDAIAVKAGEFSVVSNTLTYPTSPAYLNFIQRMLLEKNTDFVSNSSLFSPDIKEYKSVVPSGLSGKLVSNKFDVLASELTNFGVISKSKTIPEFGEDHFRLLDGALLHIESGNIISPSRSSVPDINSQTYLLGPEAGTLTMDGTYLPPAGQPKVTNVEHENHQGTNSRTFSHLLDIRFPESGGIKGVNDPQRAETIFSGTKIRVRDN